MKLLGALVVVSFIAGCATHGEVTVPVKQAVENPKFDNKTISSEVLYAQPKPGIFSGGEMQELKPIENAELSVGASRVLARFKELFARQLPLTTKMGPTGETDFTLITELTAHDKSGPAYADYDMAASMGKKFITLGLGSSEYTIRADFDVTYKLQNETGETLLTKTFHVEDSIDHERGGFDGFDIGEDLAAKLFEKNIILTMNDFFTEFNQLVR